MHVNRFEGSISFPSSPLKAEGTVKTPGGDVALKDFVAGNRGLNVVVSGDSPFSGKTGGTNSIIGISSNASTFNDETAHALGNTNALGEFLIGNPIADIRLNIQERKFDLSLQASEAFQSQQRRGAQSVGCVVGQPGCPEAVR